MGCGHTGNGGRRSECALDTVKMYMEGGDAGKQA